MGGNYIQFGTINEREMILPGTGQKWPLHGAEGGLLIRVL
jgi:hypothetical protein